MPHLDPGTLQKRLAGHIIKMGQDSPAWRLDLPGAAPGRRHIVLRRREVRRGRARVTVRGMQECTAVARSGHKPGRFFVSRCSSFCVDRRAVSDSRTLNEPDSASLIVTPKTTQNIHVSYSERKAPMKGRTPVRKPRAARSKRRRCGLCGSTTKPLTRTSCCGNWICDDEDRYVLFSFATNSCHRNHDRYTLCSSHYHERHKGRWQDCKKCRENFETEMYVWYGTNEYNFEKLANPPTFEPTHCGDCGRVIHLGTDGCMYSGGKYYCEGCGNKQMQRTLTAGRVKRKK